MKRWKTIAPAAVLILFCAFFFAANLIAPDRTFSEKENRELAAAPRFTFSALFSGTFTRDFETYLTDQFFARDLWVSLRARCERLLGKDEINGILIGNDGLLAASFAEPDPARLRANAAAVETFARNAGIPVYATLIPGASEIWRGRLPDTGRLASQAAVVESVRSSDPAAIWADTLSVLSEHAGEEIFYRTDHHWTTLGAYYGYTALVRAMGLTPRPLPAVWSETGGFYGTASSACGLEPGSGDTVALRVPANAAVSVRVLDRGEWSDGALYDMEKLALRDKYTVFLGGNAPLTVIETGHGGPKLLLVKDSYANCEIPYLCAHFSEIHVVDLRYYKLSLAAYIAENGIDAAAVSYSVANFSEDTNLFFLTK